MPPPKTDAESIDLLLLIIKHADRIDWESVATESGMYKAPGNARNAYNKIRDKHTSGAEKAQSKSKKVTAPKETIKTKASPKKRAKSCDDLVEEELVDAPKKKSKMENGEEEDINGVES